MPSSSPELTYQKLTQYLHASTVLGSINSLLHWDEQTQMPKGAGAYRAEQTTYLAGVLHQRATASELGEMLAELIESPLAEKRHSTQGANIHELKRTYDKQTKLSQRLVEELARATALGQQVWAEARQENDFKRFAPYLEKLLELKKERAEAIGYEEVPYDALLDDFEPGAKTSEVKTVLENLRKELVPLVEKIAHSNNKANVEIITRNYPISAQRKFGVTAAEAIGFNFKNGRLDVTTHPFCTETGPQDTRITTRYEENFFNSAFFGTLHEAGHGIYEQGLLNDQYGLPAGSAISLGIHESQSRMWENLVGRSYSFWEYFYPQAQAAFSEALTNVSLDEFYFAINDVCPSLIRVEADEVTYNLHILIRFELEQALINNELVVADLPAAWNEKYLQYLGIQPPNNREGVLQDVHWSAGLFGYFATYSLGNLYASQFFEKAEEDLGDLGAMFQKGEFTPLKEWLSKHIHTSGQKYTATELVQHVTGKPLSQAPLMRYLETKFGSLYA